VSADARRPPTTVDKVHALERITTRYGGVDFEPRYRLAIAMHGVLLGLATPWEIPRFIEGLYVTQRAMHAELMGLDMRNKVSVIEVPLFFFLGRNDRHVDADLAAAYFETLRAPKRSCSGSSGPRTMCRSTSRACSTKASCRRFDLLRRVGLLTIQVCGTEDNEPTGPASLA